MDNFREWLSDNLRYFMLGGAILLIVVALFFGVRACVGTKKGNSGKGDEQQEDVTAKEDQGNVPSSPATDGETDGKKDANPMETGSAEVTALIKSYYKALGEKDIATLKTFVDNLAPSDESKITNAKDYIEGYEVGDVYMKKGLVDDSYVVYAGFYYICQGIDTKVPALSYFYVFKDSDGSWKINAAADQDAEISAYTEKMLEDAEVKKLISDITRENQEAQEKDPELAAFLDGLGEDASASSAAKDGTTLVVTKGANVRAAADGEADIIGGLDAGTEVEKKGTEGEWVQIEYEGQTAYVHSSLLEEKTE